MPKKSEIPLVKKTLNFYEGDFEELKARYPNTDPSQAIRDIVHNHVELLRAQRPEPTVPVEVPAL